MNEEAAWPAIAILIAAMALLSVPRLFAALDTPPVAHQHRLSGLDGLRGVLASAVVFHHYFMLTYDVRHGTPGVPKVNFYAFIGPGAVSMFFMITGYLFWTKLITHEGVIAWGRLFANRLFRIYPLYLLLICCYFTFVVCRIDPAVQQGWRETAEQAGLWLAFGAVDHPPAFLGQEGFLGVVGQTWTLPYEWGFYLALPALSLVARQGSSFAVVLTALALVFLHPSFAAWPLNDATANFLVGMAVAHLLVARPRLDLRSPWLGAVAVLAVALAVLTFDQPFAFSTTALCGLAFVIVAGGNSIFGLLTTSGAKRLGNISYSIYLMHGLVINLVWLIPGYRAAMIADGAWYWGAFAATLLITVAVSILTHRLVELPGVALGRRIDARLRGHPTSQGAVRFVGARTAAGMPADGRAGA